VTVLARSMSSLMLLTLAVSSAHAAGCADEAGLSLPAGFCASVFADQIGHARHLVVAPDGVVYVNTWSGRYYGSDRPPPGGFLVALRDSRGVGRADVQRRFGESPSTGGHGGTGIALYKGFLYAEINDRIVRYELQANDLVPRGPAITIVSRLPLGGDHPMHPFLITPAGELLVDVASATNACQRENRAPKSPGIDPCTELVKRGGIWRFDADRPGQVFSPAQRFATGIRNGEGFALQPDGRVLVTQHGRDQLHANWPDRYRPEEEATQPAEELLELVSGGDYGWPYCYYDAAQRKLVLAPEYGGDGGHSVGRCADKRAPLAAFPAHWAPNGMVRYTGTQFPARYRQGVFIAFHGSWDRAPYPQGGYNVVFQPLDAARAAGPCEVFADGFAGAEVTPDGAQHRPSGLAVGPDGALYVSDDIRGRIYRITYAGGVVAAAPRRCPAPTAPAGSLHDTEARPPEGVHLHAGTETPELPVPPGASAQSVSLGERVFRGEVGGAACTGCHGAAGAGTPLGPPLTGPHWLWSDGSYEGIRRTIESGVAEPKRYRSAMPPMGGAQLSGEQLSAVAAYVWALGHPMPTHP